MPLLTPRSYIQMSGMILGGMIGADKRMVAYEHRARHQRRLARDMEVWRRYEEEFEKRGTPGVGGEGNVKLRFQVPKADLCSSHDYPGKGDWVERTIIERDRRIVFQVPRYG